MEIMFGIFSYKNKVHGFLLAISHVHRKWVKASVDNPDSIQDGQIFHWHAYYLLPVETWKNCQLEILQVQSESHRLP